MILPRIPDSTGWRPFGFLSPGFSPHGPVRLADRLLSETPPGQGRRPEGGGDVRTGDRGLSEVKGHYDRFGLFCLEEEK